LSRSRSALIREKFLRQCSESAHVMLYKHYILRLRASLELTNGGAAKLLRTNTNRFRHDYRICFADTVLCSFRINNVLVTLKTVLNPKRS
jgi:hypothetical protein